LVDQHVAAVSLWLASLDRTASSRPRPRGFAPRGEGPANAGRM